MEEVLKSNTPWVCTTCYNCVDRCPQEVGPANILYALKNLIYLRVLGKRRFVRSVLQLSGLIYQIGMANEVNDFQNDEREELELPNAPSVGLDGLKKMS